MRAAALLAPSLLALACASDDAPVGRGARARTVSTGEVGTDLDPFAFETSEGERIAWSPSAGLEIGGERRRPAALLVHVFQPDCPACADEARALERLDGDDDAFTAVGLAHRGGTEDVAAFRSTTGARHPMATATGSEWAQRWSRGDPTYVVDRGGRVVYAQVGFHPSDVAVWEDVIEDLRAGRDVRRTGPDRPAVSEGERLPRIELPVLGTGNTAVIDAPGGRLALERDGERRTFRAAVGFFSRY